MLNKDKDKTEQVIFLSMDDLVPKYHLFRMTESAADHLYLYNIAGALYCPDNGRPSIAPDVFFKYV